MAIMLLSELSFVTSVCRSYFQRNNRQNLIFVSTVVTFVVGGFRVRSQEGGQIATNVCISTKKEASGDSGDPKNKTTQFPEQ